MLLDIKKVMKNAKYLGAVGNHKGVPGLEQSHIFQVLLKDEPSWIIVREYAWGEFTLHSIADSEKIAGSIKKE